MMISAPGAWCSHPEAKPFGGAAKQLPDTSDDVSETEQLGS